MKPQEAAPLRPVSDEHRHEPADYELEPNKLAACPFCGGDAELRSWDWPYVRFQVRCAVCKSHARARMAIETEARKAWNQRASPATRPAKGDVREALERLTMRRHHHVASTDGDNCYQCQRDIRDPVHYRAGESHETDIQRGLTALTQAPRSCCADERERCAKIADEYAAHFALGRAAMRSMQEKAVCYDKMKTAEAIATAIRSNSHD